MKHAIILSLFVIGLLVGPMASAQQNPGRFPALRERIANAKFDYISQKLSLTDAQAEQFRPIYLAYEKEQAQLGKMKNLRMDNVNPDSISAVDAQKLLQSRFDFAQKQLDLRRKYFAEYQKVLSPQQLIKLHQAETEIRQKILMELRNRKQNLRLQRTN